MGYLEIYVVKVPPNLVKNAQYVLLYENEIHISVSFHVRYGPNTLIKYDLNTGVEIPIISLLITMSRCSNINVK